MSEFVLLGCPVSRVASHFTAFGAQGRLTEKVTQRVMQMFLRASTCPVLQRKAGRGGSVPALPAGQALEALSRGLLTSVSPLIQKGDTLRETIQLSVQLTFSAYTF